MKRAVYGLVDASRAYFLRHAKELKELGMYPLQFDPATFAKQNKGEFEAAYTAHVDDRLTVGKKRLSRTCTTKWCRSFSMVRFEPFLLNS